MKDTLQVITYVIIAVTMTVTVLALDGTPEAIAREFEWREQKMQEAQELMKNGKTDDMALKEVIRLIPFTSLELDKQVGCFARLVRESGVATNRVTTVMEGMIREVLSAVEKNERDRVSWNIGDVLPLFEAFPNYDVSPIIMECLNSRSEDYRLYALRTYAEIAGEKSIPLIQEAIKTGHLNEKNRNSLYIHLANFTILKFKEKNKTEDVAKITAFLTEMKQAEKLKKKGEN